jgi:hypothetical protein
MAFAEKRDELACMSSGMKRPPRIHAASSGAASVAQERPRMPEHKVRFGAPGTVPSY